MGRISTTKESNKTSGSKKVASKGAAHPSWAEMIKQCVVSHPEDARFGVSRPMIKKFIETKYKIELNASANAQLSRAILSGAEKGTLVLPKGPAGKVKLPPRVRADAAKENTKPSAKKDTSSSTSARKTAAVKPTASSRKSATTKTSKTAAAPSQSSARNKMPVTRTKPVIKEVPSKSNSAATPRDKTKSATVKKIASANAKKAPAKKLKTATTASKKATSSKSGVKKSAAKTAASTKAKAPKSRTAPASRTKPVSKSAVSSSKAPPSQAKASRKPPSVATA